MPSRIVSRAPITVALLFLTAASLACSSSQATTEVEVRSHSEVIDLTRFPEGGTSSVDVDIGNRVEVTIDVRQPDDQFRSCAEPSVKDSFGNTLAALTPIDATRGLSGRLSMGVQYRFALYAAAGGRYSVGLDNLQCSLGELPSEATVTWTVHSR